MKLNIGLILTKCFKIVTVVQPGVAWMVVERTGCSLVTTSMPGTIIIIGTTNKVILSYSGTRRPWSKETVVYGTIVQDIGPRRLFLVTSLLKLISSPAPCVALLGEFVILETICRCDS